MRRKSHRVDSLRNNLRKKRNQKKKRSQAKRFLFQGLTIVPFHSLDLGI